MASVPVPGTVEVELVQGLDGEIIENTLYFHKTGGWSVPEMQGLAGDLVSWWDTEMQGAFTTGTALINVIVTDLTGPEGGKIEFTTGLPLAGSGNEESMPNNVAPAITFHTASRGRSFRGRNYISGIPASQCNGNRLLGAYGDFLTAAYNALLAVATANACEWVVVSRYSGTAIVDGKKKAVPRVTGISTPILSASFKDLVVDSQRNRLPNH